jgi:hypothetical protein
MTHTEVVRTPWHAAGGETSRARCGDPDAILVTGNRNLVTCPQCLDALHEEENDGVC